MNYYISFLLFFLCLPNSEASYRRLSLHEVLNLSQMMVEAEIIFSDDSHIIIEVIDPLKGAAKGDKIRVKKFENWPCASRWESYKIGQKSIFCLWTRGENLETVGFGNEGELPIITDNVYFIFYPGNENFPEINNASGFRFSLKETKEGINEYYNKKSFFDAIIADKTILGYKPINALLFHLTIELIIKNYKELDLSYLERGSWIRRLLQPKGFQGIWEMKKIETATTTVNIDSLTDPCKNLPEITISFDYKPTSIEYQNKLIQGQIIGKSNYKMCIINPETVKFEESINGCSNIIIQSNLHPYTWFEKGENTFREYKVSLKDEELIMTEIIGEQQTEIISYRKKKKHD